MTKRSVLYCVQAFLLLAIFALCCASRLPAQTGSGSLRGTVVDQSRGAVANAPVKATSATGQVVNGNTNATGAYELTNLPPGPYTVEVNVTGFAPITKEGVTVTANRTQQLDITLQIAEGKEEVTVSGEALAVDTSASNNAGAVVLNEAELEALPDDPDELQADLEALAGPSTGPNGGQMYIDGFTAGTLPPKASIREIRINSNPFSAEYDRPGFGRIEILTKPGGNAWHGSVSVNRNQAAFNTGNPFATSKGDFQSTQYEGNIGGGLGKTMSLFMNADYRGINNFSVVNATIVGPGPTFAQQQFQALNPLPQSRLNVGPRFDWQVNKNNTLTARYQFERNSTTNGGVGNFILPVQGSNVLQTEDQLQLTDSQYFGSKIVYETRFQYLHQVNNNVAANLIPSVTVPGAFTGGGSGNNLDAQNHFELQSYTSINFLKHFLKFGVRVRDVTDSNNSNSAFFGSYQFPSLAAYQAMLQALSNPGASPTNLVGAGCNPGVCGPNQYAVTVGNPNYNLSVVDAGPFIQDDWKVRPNVTLSYGLRFETQNHISNHMDWAPRVAVAWGIGRSKTGSKFVLRAGSGIFYTRLAENNILQALRQNGTTEQQYLVANPNFYCGPTTPTGTTVPFSSTCSVPSLTSGNLAVPTTYQIAPNFHAPFMLQTNLSIERQVTKAVQVSLTYLNGRGFDQLLQLNANSPVLQGVATSVANGGVYPNGTAQNILQFASTGKFEQNQFIANTTIRGARVTLNAYYALNFANSTPNGFVSDPYNILLDYGRAGGNFGVRDRAFVIGTIRLPYGMTAAPAVQITSGTPYSITIGKDLLGTGVAPVVQRPGIVSSATCATTQITGSIYCTPVGTFDSTPTAGETILPINSLAGPVQVSVNLRLSKTWTFGPAPEGGQGQRRPGGGGGGGGPAAGPQGGRGGGAPPGGFGGGGGGRGGPANGRFSFTTSINARNLFNRLNLAPPVGNLTSPRFDESESLANVGPGGSVVANRQVYLQTTFSF